jgi:CRP-like cAMP-binding protein
MHPQLKRYPQFNIAFTDEPFNEIAKHFEPLTAKKNATLVAQGDICKKLYFVAGGCIRTYYLTEKGNEKTRFIAMEGMVATSLTSFISQQPSFEFVGTLEDSDLLYINYDNFFALVEESPAWEKFYRTLLEAAYIYQNKKIEQMVTLSAGERYAALMKEHPLFIQRLSNKILASYLDITQETLSRLKSR